jgi:hypothetical protein
MYRNASTKKNLSLKYTSNTSQIWYSVFALG